MRVLVTGATGLVGRAVVDRLIGGQRYLVRAAIRQEANDIPTGVELVTGELSSDFDWRPALADVSAVVHLAARVHIMGEPAGPSALEAFRRVNVVGTLNLAEQAAAAGIRRFVYLSSIKVHGESGMFTETDPPRPEDPYGISKHEAELGLRQIANERKLDVVIVRPPLVYGPRVRANFGVLIRAVRMGIPLPLGAVHNQRSFVAVDNLADFAVSCLSHPRAAGEVFLVSDGEDLSTTELIRRLADAMNRRARLVPLPAAVLMAAATAIGKRDVARRLLGTLRVDITKARTVLAWSPPLSVDEGLRRAVAGR
jgi:nucleoside-diphosphate-sugar epimerase